MTFINIFRIGNLLKSTANYFFATLTVNVYINYKKVKVMIMDAVMDAHPCLIQFLSTILNYMAQFTPK